MSATVSKVIVYKDVKTMHHHANGRFDWLISEHQSIEPSKEAISILSRKYKRSMFVRPVISLKIKHWRLFLKNHLVIL